MGAALSPRGASPSARNSNGAHEEGRDEEGPHGEGRDEEGSDEVRDEDREEGGHEGRDEEAGHEEEGCGCGVSSGFSAPRPPGPAGGRAHVQRTGSEVALVAHTRGRLKGPEKHSEFLAPEEV